MQRAIISNSSRIRKSSAQWPTHHEHVERERVAADTRMVGGPKPHAAQQPDQSKQREANAIGSPDAKQLKAGKVTQTLVHALSRQAAQQEHQLVVLAAADGGEHQPCANV